MPTSQSRASSLVVLFVSAGLAVAAATAEAGTPMYRFYKSTTGEHFYTATFTEGVNAGFKSEGIGFQFYSSSAIGRIAIYRCAGGGRHFISTSSNCESQTVEGTYGYVDSSQLSGDVGVVRYYSSAGGDHVYTTDSGEGAALVDRGYVSEGTIGYVPAYTVTTASGQACNGSTDDTSTLQTALNNAAGGHLIIPAGSGPCMVSGLSVPSNTQLTVNATLKLVSGVSTELYGDHTRNILNAYWVSNVVIDGMGILDGNRSNQTATTIFMAGVGTLYSDDVIIRGLTIQNVLHSPVNAVATDGVVIQDVTASYSATPVEFAGGTSNCSADGLRIHHIDGGSPPSEAGFAFYGGVSSCALRNSVISDSTYGVIVMNDAGQAGACSDIVVENVEVYTVTAYGLAVVTQDNLTAYNDNVLFQHIRLHNYGASYHNYNGTNVTFTDISLTSGTTPLTTITGDMNGFGSVGGGAYDLYGWACTTYDPDSIQVALYVGASSPTTGIGWFPATQLSESGVATACSSGGVAHRFVIHFTPSMISTYGGQKVWVYGISPWGFANNAITGSGTVTIPQ